jgi:hypothetical protein
MKKSVIFGIAILALVWLALSFLLIKLGGFNLKNLLVMCMTAIIIFYPLKRKYFDNN